MTDRASFCYFHKPQNPTKCALCKPHDYTGNMHKYKQAPCCLAMQRERRKEGIPPHKHNQMNEVCKRSLQTSGLPFLHLSQTGLSPLSFWHSHVKTGKIRPTSTGNTKIVILEAPGQFCSHFRERWLPGILRPFCSSTQWARPSSC